jgi:tetratricopeptide (TPR) repeat protein
MSKRVEVELGCPFCGHRFPAELYRTIWIEYSELRDLVFRDEVNRFTCPRCQKALDVDFSLFATNRDVEFAVWYEPKHDAQIDKDIVYYTKQFGPDHYLTAAPRVSTWNEFKRAILLFEHESSSGHIAEIDQAAELDDEALDRVARLFSERRYEDALAVILPVIQQQESPHWNALYLAGQSCRFLERLPEAEGYLQASADVCPSVDSVFLALGIVQQLQGDFETACQSLSHAIRINPRKHLAHNSLGITLKEMGRWSDAEDAYRDALKWLFREIAVSLPNKRNGTVFPDCDSQGELWHDFVQESANWIATSEEAAESASWPTEQQADEERKTKYHGGLMYKHSQSAEGKHVLYFLPNFKNGIVHALNRDFSYSICLNNLGCVFTSMGRNDEARLFFHESIEFTPEGADYPPPRIGLQSLDSSESDVGLSGGRIPDSQMDAADKAVGTGVEKVMGMDVRRQHNDPLTMKTEFGRKVAAAINRKLETSETRLHRLNQVLNEYFMYTDALQLDLAEAAIMWSFAALAVHERRETCESNFFAVIDLMYPSTEDAMRSESESQREQIFVAASAVQRHLISGINEIVPPSLQTIASYGDGNIALTTAEWLNRIRSDFLEHSPRQQLCDLIGRCVIMCTAMDAKQLGVGSGRMTA